MTAKHNIYLGLLLINVLAACTEEEIAMSDNFSDGNIVTFRNVDGTATGQCMIQLLNYDTLKPQKEFSGFDVVLSSGEGGELMPGTYELFNTPNRSFISMASHSGYIDGEGVHWHFKKIEEIERAIVDVQVRNESNSLDPEYSVVYTVLTSGGTLRGRYMGKLKKVEYAGVLSFF